MTERRPLAAETVGELALHHHFTSTVLLAALGALGLERRKPRGLEKEGSAITKTSALPSPEIPENNITRLKRRKRQYLIYRVHIAYLMYMRCSHNVKHHHSYFL